jgi:sortase (surface protein transpeptidase)
LIERPPAAALAALLALVGGLLTARGVMVASTEDAPVRTQAVVPSAKPPEKASTPAKARVARSVPVRLDIPSIGVHTKLIRLGLNKDGTVEVPPLDGQAPAGWYEHSVTPGETGPAVILGHVDSARDGPAVFYRLASLKPGAEVSVRRTDGTTIRFAVTLVARYPKTGFPTTDVYGPTPYPALRLVTCGGSFDRNRGSYRDNVVVSAR